jgi:uncharacterized protein YggU (UPF0235/DUF167 family)
MSLPLAQSPRGPVVAVRAAPNARADRVIGIHGSALKVAVAAPPERGKANDRIAAVLAEALGLPVRCFTLLSGAASKDKRFLVLDVDVALLQQRLQALLSRLGPSAP